MPLNLSQPKRKQTISLTPLIDVVFILLLFFMLTSSFVPWRVVDTPLAVAETKATPEQRDIVILILKQNDDQVWFDKEGIAFADQSRFQQLVADHQEATFVIKADDGVTLQTLMHLADRLKQQGAKTVSIANAFAMPEKQ